MNQEYRLRSIIDFRNLNSISKLEATVKSQPSQTCTAGFHKDINVDRQCPIHRRRREAAIGFYTTHLGFTLLSSKLLAFADVLRGDLRLLLSGPTSSEGR